MSILEQLGALAAGGIATTVSDTTRQALRLHVADTVAAWAGGARTAEGRLLVRFTAGAAAPRPGREGMLDRLMLNCAVTRLSEIDNIHLASGTTPGAVVVPAALTLAAALHEKSAAVLQEAILAGYEAMIRLGLAIDGPKVLYRGIWPTYFVAGFGVAAAASRLLALDGRQAANALAMALSMAAPNVGQQGGPAMSRWLLFGQAARSGGMAALAAQAGFTGDIQLLDKEFLPTVYGITPRAEALTAGLGNASVAGGISFKPWCAARQTMAATQAVKEMAQAGVAAADIESLVIGVPPAYLKMVNHGVVKGDRSSHLTSAPYQVALGLVAPEAGFGLEHTLDEVAGPVRSLMAKITVEADEALAAHFPRTWPAKVTVQTKSGRQEKLMLHVPGDPERAFGEAEVGDKFRRVLTPLLGVPRAGELLARALATADGNDDAAALVAEIEGQYGEAR